MDLRGSLVKIGESHLFVRDIMDTGMLLCKTAVGVVNNTKPIHFDPLVRDVKVSHCKLIDYERFSPEELEGIVKLNKNIEKEKIAYAYGYKNPLGHSLLLFSMTDGTLHVLYLKFGDVYGISLLKGSLVCRYLYDTDNMILGKDLGFNCVSWIKMAVLFKMKDAFCNPSMCQTLGRLMHLCPCNTKINLQVFKYKENECYSDVGLKMLCDGTYMVINPAKFNKVLGSLDLKWDTLKRDTLIESMREMYGDVCCKFSESELDTVENVLKHNGYECILQDVRSNNGSRSCFRVSDDLWVGIVSGKRGSYTLNMFKVVPIKSEDRVLWYEIRRYPLCESSEYSPVYASFSRECCVKILEDGLADMARGSLITLEEYPFEIVSLVCKEKYISIRYSYRNRSTMYKAIYRKETMVWEYKTPCNDVKEKDFLIDVLNRFDLVQSNMEYRGYIILDGKVIISEKTAMCTGKSLDSVCESLQNEVTNNYIIVEYNGYKKTNMWIYNNKDNKLDKMSIVY